MRHVRRQPLRKRPGALNNSAQAPLEVATLLARTQEAAALDSAAQQKPKAASPMPSSVPLDAKVDPPLLAEEEVPGFISGTVTEAVPVTHGGRTYKVKPQDTVLSIAAKHGVSVPALIELNHLQGASRLQPGQMLSLPEKNLTPPPASHRVQPGDTLDTIAVTYGTTVEALKRANSMNTALIRTGEILMLTGSGAASSRREVTAPQSPAIFSKDVLEAGYPPAVLEAARINRYLLSKRAIPRREWVHKTVSRLAGEIGVDTSLALALAMQESGLSHRTVSPVNAIGIMQLTPRAGQWAASMAGRPLDILDPADNIVAGLTILKHLIVTTGSVPGALAAYYQGASSVERHGMSADTRNFVRMVQVLADRYTKAARS